MSPWLEISAWILAFTLLLGAQCASEHVSADRGPVRSAEAAQRR